MDSNNFYIKQLTEIIDEYFDLVNQQEHFGSMRFKKVTVKAKAAIGRIAGESSEYYKETSKLIANSTSSEAYLMTQLADALRSDLSKGYLKSLSQIIQSDVFADYLDMAEHLLDEGYKDPAAVLIGSTLEEHLRKLCEANEIDLQAVNQKGVLVPKKADLLNSELAKAGVYTGAYQKQVVAWFGLRNSAAHGKYTEYSEEQIKLMLQGVRQFTLFTN